MLSQEENEWLARVGPGTPAGKLLRRYWHVVGAASELSDEKPKKRVKVLGEDLVLFRDRRGTYGLVGEHCSTAGHPSTMDSSRRTASAAPIMDGSTTLA